VGTLRGEGLTLEQRALGWRLGEGTLAARFDGETFEVQSLRLVSLAKGGGWVEMRGQVKAEGLEGRFDFVAQRLVVPIGPGQRVVMSGDASVASTRGRFEIRGKLKADEGRIELAGGDVPALPEDVIIRQPDGAQREGEAASAAKRLRIDAALELDLGENLRIRGSGLDARLTGVVALRGSLPGAPRAFGTVRVRDGRYTAYGQNLVITRGRVIFNGALDNPVLDIVALRRDQAVEAGVAVTGTVLDPRIKLTSTPDVPDAEKLSWLVLGVPLDSAQTGDQGAALQAAAISLFGSREGGVGAGLKESLGLDVFTVRGAGGGSLLPSGFGEASPVPGQLGSFSKSPTGARATDNVFVIGKRLSKEVIVTYEQGLSGATSLVSIQYDFARRFSLRAQTGSEADGQSALDLIFRYPFD
jgi:translocation and assembly module TamB